MNFATALASISSLGVDISHMKDYMDEFNSIKIGPNIKFHGVNEAKGGYTPPL